MRTVLSFIVFVAALARGESGLGGGLRNTATASSISGRRLVDGRYPDDKILNDKLGSLAMRIQLFPKTRWWSKREDPPMSWREKMVNGRRLPSF